LVYRSLALWYET